MYALTSLLLHLDKAADETSAKRLIRLARYGFAQLKAERERLTNLRAILPTLMMVIHGDTSASWD
jgi:hypothetical protein